MNASRKLRNTVVWLSISMSATHTRSSRMMPSCSRSKTSTRERYILTAGLKKPLTKPWKKIISQKLAAITWFKRRMITCCWKPPQKNARFLISARRRDLLLLRVSRSSLSWVRQTLRTSTRKSSGKAFRRIILFLRELENNWRSFMKRMNIRQLNNG